MSDDKQIQSLPASSPGMPIADTGSIARISGPTGVARIALFLLLAHLLFEYLRLHQLLPFLSGLYLPALTLALLLLFTVGELLQGRSRVAPQGRLLLAFLGLAAFSILLATNSFWAYQFTYGLVLTMIGYLAITHFLQTERDIYKFLSVLIGIHIYLGAIGLVGFSRTPFNEFGYASTGAVGGSFLADENDFALALNMALPLAIYLLRHSRSALMRLLWRAGSLIILLAIVFTFSRGGFIGLVAMLVYWAATSVNKRRAIGALVLAAALITVVAPEQYWDRIETITDTDSGTARIRKDSWAAARRMFYDSPIVGVGANNFAVLFPDYALEYPEERRGRMWGRAAHSMYFQLLAEFGLLGVLLIGWLLVLNFRSLNQIVTMSRQEEISSSLGQLARSVRASWIGFLVSATFISVLTYPHLYYLTGLTVALQHLATRKSGETSANALHDRQGHK